ncbi:hypothetical protein GOODEAATRI_020549 [Goodea atripinnis]|uniref:Uncharacterized protein n=1 Tax=Goodea atripinnis TaxID=208336 RepID=A0ABV0Q0B3_9TELE
MTSKSRLQSKAARLLPPCLLTACTLVVHWLFPAATTLPVCGRGAYVLIGRQQWRSFENSEAPADGLFTADMELQPHPEATPTRICCHFVTKLQAQYHRVQHRKAKNTISTKSSHLLWVSLFSCVDLRRMSPAEAAVSSLKLCLQAQDQLESAIGGVLMAEQQLRENAREVSVYIVLLVSYCSEHPSVLTQTL